MRNDLENREGVVFDPNNKKVLFAEDWNELVDYVLGFSVDNLSDAYKDIVNKNLFLGHSGFSGTFYNSENVVFGFNSFTRSNTDNSKSYYGDRNSVFGVYVMRYNTTGYYNSAFGAYAMRYNTTGYHNSAFGTLSLYGNRGGSYNSAFGSYSLHGNFDGYANSAFGAYAMRYNTSGNKNSAFGYAALMKNTTGNSNVAVGRYSLYGNETGYQNVSIGSYAGRFIADGSTLNKSGNRNVFIGYFTSPLSDGDTNEIVIGYRAVGVGSNSVVLGNDDIVKTILKGNIGAGVADPQARIHAKGNVIFENLPTSASGLPAGSLWNDNGVLKIV